jgi:hypothetical protein
MVYTKKKLKDLCTARRTSIVASHICNATGINDSNESMMLICEEPSLTQPLTISKLRFLQAV